MRIGRFLFLTLLGAGIWSALGATSYDFGRKFEWVHHYLGPVSTAVMVAIANVYLYRAFWLWEA